MSAVTFTDFGVQTFVVIRCGACGIHFGVPEHFDKECREGGHRKTFYCPNGHARAYHDSTSDLLREKLRRADAEIEYQKKRTTQEAQRRVAAENRERAQKAAKTRLKNRIANGVCPCCNRHFTNVERHIKTKHPEWKEGKE